MRVVIIIQARTNSSRLAGKALLPVGKYPSSVLAALRAGSAGHEVVVATSTEPTDDALTQTLESYGIRVIRGPLDDVLARYTLAAAGLPDAGLVVRLTADNVVPDGKLVEELTAAFAEAGVEYLSQDSPQSRLPYGLGGEAFSAATLRRANAAATGPWDREHVSPWMRRNCRTAIHQPTTLGGADYSHLRCTIDDEEDYRRICRLFQDLADPVRVGWLGLAKKLASLPGEPAFRVPYKVVSGRIQSELTLGTVQLGMEYGITNRTGQPSRPLAIQMIRHAIAHGVTTVDTARGYGAAEHVLGDALAGAWRSRVEVITKLDPLVSLAHDADAPSVHAAVDESVKCSCENLGVSKLGTLLLHRVHHYHSWGGAAWRRLLELRDEGKIGILGASVYEPRDALEVIEDPAIQHLQIPMNILDWRWRANAVDQALKDRPDVVVHARSALLQGLLAGPAELWRRLVYPQTSTYPGEIERFAAEFGREGSADLCLAYVRSQSWIHSIVLGCETLEQVSENLRLFCRPKLSAEQCAELENSLPRASETLLNPAQWKFTSEQSPS